MFSRHANGGHRQQYRNEKLGISVNKIKENRDTPWRQEVTMDALPGKTFKDYTELRKFLEENDVENDKTKVS